MIVVDASVAAKWFLPEPDSAAAEALVVGQASLIAPDLLRLEVAAAITRRARTGNMPDAEAERRCEYWFASLTRGEIRLIPSEPDIPEAVLLALQIKHSLQDCLYLAVARRLSVPLITSDRTFADRARKIHPTVRLLVEQSE